MRSITKFAVLAALAGGIAVAAAGPSEAHWRPHHVRHHVWIHHGSHAYAYAPRHHYRNASNRNEHDCLKSPASLQYKPCMNKP